MRYVDVLYTVDKKYVNYMLVSMYSLMEKNGDLEICFHVICDGLDKEDYNHIDCLINSFDNVNIKFYDFDSIKKIILKYEVPEWNGSYMSNTRLFFDTCINDVDKLLYLDSDTIVVDSLANLDHYNETIHMVRDSMPFDYWNNLDSHLKHYYNSGVIWIDTKKWESYHCHEKIIHGLENHIPYKYPDQDLINLTLNEYIYDLSPNYNLFSTDYYFHLPFLYRYYDKAGILRYSKKEMMEAKQNPIILHNTPFYGFRGWSGSSIHPFYHYYSDYFNRMGLSMESSDVSTNEFLFRLNLYAHLICPKKFSKVKEYIKRSKR